MKLLPRSKATIHMKTLGNLAAPQGANKKTKRLGRGPGSGQGKTAGKGHKGQKARKGKTGPTVGFEGGQTPLHKRIPKFGFSNKRFATKYRCIKVQDLNRLYKNEETVDKETLMKYGLLQDTNSLVKILGNGELKKKLTVKANKVTKGAKQAIEAAGGVIEEI
jgi:large subunit ribosomal protein L15